MKPIRSPLCAFLLLPAAACGDATPTWRPIALTDLSPAATAQRAVADRAREDLQRRLQQALTAALADGPVAAIAACRTRAPELAAAVAREYGVRIGRTSHRLRNAQNAAPAWAAHLATAPCTEAAAYAGPDGELGLVQPIALQPLCVQCHGPAAQLGADTAAALREQYPDDRATGFVAGDPRGCFWVEVPAR